MWRTAVVTPISKIPRASNITDFRPISVTLILSRMIEKIIVKEFIRPSLTSDILDDQFAYKPTGSTTAALVTILHHVTKLLEDNSFVRCILIDFSKAFDVIDHKILMYKLSRLNIDPHIIQWIASFLNGRCQVTKLNCSLSSL
jgi:hypothetical protein